MYVYIIYILRQLIPETVCARHVEQKTKHIDLAFNLPVSFQNTPINHFDKKKIRNL